MIDHVDTLTVGGAAAYGSDAIAGVINYIIKDKYVGSRSAQASFAHVGEGRRQPLQRQRHRSARNLLNDRANLTLFSFEDTKTDALYGDKPARGSSTLATAVNNAFNGSKRNPAFAPTAAIDVARA